MIDKEKKEYISLAIGFVLIIFVFVFTLMRNDPFPKKSSDSARGVLGLKNSTLQVDKMIGAKDLQKKIMAGSSSDLVLLDVRTFEKYIAEHIIDSINIPPEEFPVTQKIDTKKLIVVIGSDSGDENVIKAVENLKSEKIENYNILTGGMDSWKKNAGATISYGDPNSFVDQSKVSYVSPDDLKNALDQKVPMFVVDIRNNEEFSKGHIPGAKNLPLQELEKRRSEIIENKVVVVGVNELEEFQASVQMNDMLLVSPFVLKGAMPQWEKNGYPIEK